MVIQSELHVMKLGMIETRTNPLFEVASLSDQTVLAGTINGD